MTPEGSGAILCFGEVLARLSTTPGKRLSNTTEMTLHVGGAESNVAAVLAQLGHEVEMITALPNSALGDLCLADLRRYRIRTRQLVRADGRLGLYFFEPDGSGGRIIYDRGHSAFLENAGAFDWPALARDARWFHLSGINLALGGEGGSSALSAVSGMNDAAVPVSFDVNHRASLWEEKSSAEFAAVRQIASRADYLFANAHDLSRLLETNLSSDTADDRRAAAEAALNAFPSLRAVISTRRTIDMAGQQLLARIDSREAGYETSPAPLHDVIDRIGSGDALAGAVIDRILRGAPPEQCVKLGLSAAVMKHGLSGDRWVGTREELEAFDPFVARDIQR